MRIAHEQSFALAHQTLDEIVPLAGRIGCVLVIEVCYDLATRPLIELVRSFPDNAVRLSLDVGHAHINERRGGPPADQWVRDAGALLTHLHLQDTDGLYDRHWPPGRGSLNWYALFEALGRHAHEPRLLLELVDTDQIATGAAFLVQRGLVR